MKKKFKFECESCGAEYTISFEEDEDNFMGQDITCCPFCGDDCERPEQEEDLDKDPI
jgi:hypothetical protein|tara:strand:- start:3945 stop:4115 length:171 start_codon:yes stop_codon:yes gene_type:complete